jgi:hypothetical protein
MAAFYFANDTTEQRAYDRIHWSDEQFLARSFLRRFLHVIAADTGFSSASLHMNIAICHGQPYMIGQPMLDRFQRGRHE